MKLETKRLFIIPLTAIELSQYIDNDGVLEQNLNLNPIKRIISDRVEFVIRTKILPAIYENSENLLLLTFWILVDKVENNIVGAFCFKGKPNENGAVEIGYGTQPKFEGKGLMTEAVSEIVNWAFQQNGIKAVIAETDLTNNASQRILEKNNFEKIETTATSFWWQIEK